MGPVVMIVGKVVLQDCIEMPLIQDDHVIETVSPDAPHDAFAKWILPRFPGLDEDFFSSQALNQARECRIEDSLAIPEEISGSGIPRESLKDLQTRPLGMGMTGDVEVDDASSVVAQDRSRFEVRGLRFEIAMCRRLKSHNSNLKPSPQQLAMDPGRSPERVGFNHILDGAQGSLG